MPKSRSKLAFPRKNHFPSFLKLRDVLYWGSMIVTVLFIFVGIAIVIQEG